MIERKCHEIKRKGGNYWIWGKRGAFGRKYFLGLYKILNSVCRDYFV